MFPNESKMVKLLRTWIIGSEITSGGFGRIYEATNEDDLHAVIKLVPKAPGASRELLFESLSSHPNIIPIVDGKLAETWTHFEALAHFRWFDYCRVMTVQQEIAPEATKAFHSRLLMSLNTESEQDPQKRLSFRVIYHNICK